MRDAIRVRHYSIRTEQACLFWIKRFIRFADDRHPRDLGGAEVAAFLTDLAVESRVAAATQNQAPRSGARRRHPLHETALPKAVKRAVRQAAIKKPAGCHTLRHWFATPLL